MTEKPLEAILEEKYYNLIHSTISDMLFQIKESEKKVFIT